MSRESRRREDEAAREWKGTYRRYDIVREASIALGVVLALAVVLTLLFSSPDLKPSTIQAWSRGDPVDFVTTAATELDGSSGTGSYGPPYNHASDGQHIAFIYLAKWLGVSHPINSAQDFVLAPLRSISGQPALASALSAYQAAPRNDGFSAHVRPEWRARRRAADQQAVLPDRLHKAAAVHGRRRGARDPPPAKASARHPVGNDERDRQLPRAGLAVALYLLVPDQTVLDLGQRRHPRDGRNGRAEPRLHPDSIHPRSPRSSPQDPDLQADLARSLPHPAKQGAPSMSEATHPQSNGTLAGA